MSEQLRTIKHWNECRPYAFIIFRSVTKNSVNCNRGFSKRTSLVFWSFNNSCFNRDKWG